MKILTFIIFFVILTLTLSAREELPNIKFVDTYCGYKLSMPSFLYQIGDTLVFSSNENDTNFIYLAYQNKCTRLSVYEFGDPTLGVHFYGFALNGAAKDNWGNIWFATNWGLAQYDGKSVKMKTEFITNKDSIIYTMSKDSAGFVYFIINNGSIMRIDSAGFSRFTIDTNPKYLPDYWRDLALIYKDNKFYFLNVVKDVGYFDLSDKKFYSTGLTSLIDKMDLEKYEPNITTMFRKGNLNLFGENFIVFDENIKKIPMILYDGKNIKFDYTLWDSSTTENRLNNYLKMYIDKKKRKWLTAYYFEDFNISPLYVEHLVIDSNNNIFRIPAEKYGTTNATDTARLYNTIYGVAELSNGVIYATLRKLGFVVEDPTGVSVEENETQEPSFFMQKVRPNPFKDYTKIDILATQSAIDNMQVEIIDYLGKSIRKVIPLIEYQPANGKASLEIETTGIEPGYYYLILKDGNNIRSEPIIIK